MVSRTTVRLILLMAVAIVALAPNRAASQVTPYCGPIDVVFVIDETDSMHDELVSTLATSFKKSMPAIVNQIANASNRDPMASLYDYRLALVTFRDDITVRLNLADNNRAAFEPLIVALTNRAGGAREADASDEATRTVVWTLPAAGRVGPAGDQRQNIDFMPAFRPNALKIIVLFTDSPPGAFDDNNDVAHNLQAMLRADEAAAKGIKIVSVFAPDSPAQDVALPVMQYYAAATHPGADLGALGTPFVNLGKEVVGQGILEYFQACTPRNRPPIAECTGRVANSPTCTPVARVDADIDNSSYDPDSEVISFSYSPPGPYEQGYTNVTLTVTDGEGATASCQAEVTITGCNMNVVVPTVAPKEAEGPGGAIVNYPAATATDGNGDPITPVTCLPASGAMFPLGITEVTCTATASGVTVTNWFTIEVADTTAPTVSLTVPSGTLSGLVGLSATAADLVGVARVEFHVDGIPIGLDLRASYNAIWNSAFVKDGIHTLKARACDAAGNCTDTSGTVVTVSNAAPIVPAGLTASSPSPAPYGTEISWTASASGGLAPLEYQFWRYSYMTGTWTVVQGYSTGASYTWTTVASDVGVYAFQVWIRSSGSSAIYEAYAGTSQFIISGTSPATVTSLTTPATSPMPAGTQMTWTATASGGTPPLLYEFSRYCMAAPGWSIVRAYSETATYSWTPAAADAGMCYMRVRVKSTGSAVPYESSRDTSGFMITGANPIALLSVTANPAPSAQYGTSVTWTATALDGIAPLEYQFWRYSYSAGKWTMVRDYTTSQIYTWIPAIGDVGQYVVHARVRSAGKAAFEAYRDSAVFTVSAAPPAAITSLTRSTPSPTLYGTPITWTAAATGGVGPLQYEFWRYCMAAPGWSLAQPYSIESTYTWTPQATDAGMCYARARVRSDGSSLAYEATRDSPGVMITGSNPIAIVSLTGEAVAPSGTAATWTATASGGTSPLEYQFWRYSYALGTWSMVRDYNQTASYVWTPTVDDVGQYVIHVRVRSALKVAFEAYRESTVTVYTP